MWLWLKFLNDRRGKPQVLVHVSTYQGNPFWNSGFLSHGHVGFHVFETIAICFSLSPDPRHEAGG